jgi:hypothetical protein
MMIANPRRAVVNRASSVLHWIGRSDVFHDSSCWTPISAAATKLLAVGDGKNDTRLKSVELAESTELTLNIPKS